MKKLTSLIILVIPFLLLFIYWEQIPEKFPVHLNIQGEVDRYSDSKWEILILPVINLLVFGLVFIVPKIDPKRNFIHFFSTYWTVINIIMLLLLLIFVGMLYYALGYHFDLGIAIQTSIVFFFLLIGNLSSKLRPNYFIGIKTPWTLESEEVWKKTHRMAGVLWVVSSAVMLIIVLISAKLMNILFIPYACLLVLIPFVYSYRIHKKLTAEITKS